MILFHKVNLWVSSTQEKSSTVDDKDVRHHSQFSEDWWDTHGQLKPLHSFNPLRVKFVRDGLRNTGHKSINASRPLEGLKILDVGCGGGILSEPLARLGANVTGLDASLELIAIAEEHKKLDKNLAINLNYVQNVIEDWKEENKGKFDAVVASEILEHVIDPDLFLKSCSEVLKPNGSIFITTINKTPLSFLGAIIAAEYVFKILPLGTHDWNKFISPEETRRILNKCELMPFF